MNSVFFFSRYCIEWLSCGNKYNRIWTERKREEDRENKCKSTNKMLQMNNELSNNSLTESSMRFRDITIKSVTHFKINALFPIRLHVSSIRTHSLSISLARSTSFPFSFCYGLSVSIQFFSISIRIAAGTLFFLFETWFDLKILSCTTECHKLHISTHQLLDCNQLLKLNWKINFSNALFSATLD